MNQKLTKEQELIQRAFKLIAKSHFRDHKLSPTYLWLVEFDRSLGDDLSAYVHKAMPDYYEKKKLEFQLYNQGTVNVQPM